MDTLHKPQKVVRMPRSRAEVSMNLAVRLKLPQPIVFPRDTITFILYLVIFGAISYIGLYTTVQIVDMLRKESWLVDGWMMLTFGLNILLVLLGIWGLSYVVLRTYAGIVLNKHYRDLYAYGKLIESKILNIENDGKFCNISYVVDNIINNYRMYKEGYVSEHGYIILLYINDIVNIPI